MKSTLTDHPKIDSVTIGYDPIHQSAVEVSIIDETLVALMPWGEHYTGLKANEILKTIVQDDRIQVREL